ncbi:MAG: TIGR00269 family protein [Halobacteriota archaeon]|nr:TIGR00269 family protein [Halobacteriota archaeon]
MEDRIKCFKCKEDAIVYQRYSGMHLCPGHLIEDIERKIKKNIRKNFTIKKNERIAVALSGGKDSTVTLYILKKIFSERRDIAISAITVDEGIRGYREKTIKKARKFTEDVGIDHRIVSFEEEYGITLDEIAGRGEEQAPCTFCGVLRRQLLNKTAKELEVDRVATGHNLDDESQTILMNYLRGDIERLARTNTGKAGFVPRIKLLQDIPEREVALYAIVNNLEMDMSECPYANFALRSEIREMLNDFEVRHPGTKYSLIRGFGKISDGLSSINIDLSECEVCGEPCNGVLCKACQLLSQVGRI